jgi:predicted MFS family arabinose efflux permease
MDDARHLRLMGAGIAMVGTSFGLARYGYGLLLPDIRQAFHVSNATLGLIATGSYLAYLTGTAIVAAAGKRFGSAVPVVLGGLLAVTGMLIVAAARTPAVLGLGVLIAGASAAFAYPPFSDAVARDVPDRRQGRVLSVISSGTGWGVALAVLVAIAAGSHWRAAWVAFAAIGVASTAGAAIFLRSRDRGAAASSASAHPLPPLSWSWFVCPRSGPLLVGALLVGIGASVYWTFSADYVAAHGLPRTAAAVLLAGVGLASILGSFAGDVLNRLGGRPALQVSALALAASLFLLAAAPSSWLAVVASAIVFGATYNLLLSVQAIWSGRVFSQRPSTGLAAMLFMLGIGQLVGPALAGILADGVGLGAAFCVGGATIAAAALLPPREELRAPSAPQPARA